MYYWLISVDTSDSSLSNLKQTWAWLSGDLYKFGFTKGFDSQLYLSYKYVDSATDIWGVLEAVDIESGDVDWISSNNGYDFTFGPVAFQEDLVGNRQVSSCIVEEIPNNDKLHVSRYYFPVGISLKDHPTEAEEVEIDFFFDFTVLSAGAFFCEGIHSDNTKKSS